MLLGVLFTMECIASAKFGYKLLTHSEYGVLGTCVHHRQTQATLPLVSQLVVQQTT